MKRNDLPQIFVSGHRNPDIDSLASAAALAEFRRRHTKQKVIPICPGVLPERAKYLFDRFNIKPPVCRNDLYVRAGDIVSQVPAVTDDTVLFEALAMLKESGLPRLPVIDADGKWRGMLSGMAFLGDLLAIGEESERSFTGRRVFSSIGMIRRVLDAELLTGCDLEVPQYFEVYVAAMGKENFQKHLPNRDEELAIIVGDREDIHRSSIARKVRLLIITGSCSVNDAVLESAAAQRVTILRTALDSATVIRRLKFSTPIGKVLPDAVNELTVTLHDRVKDIREPVMAYLSDVIPVVEEDGMYKGVILKRSLNAKPPFQMILVDHNEIEQSLPGAKELPVIEVVDHHRIGMMPTADPIRFTGDIVGSTCTLVASMFRSSGESLSPEMAGLLLGGVISDTLLLKSPTTAELDLRMVEWLEKVSGVKGAELMDELLKIDSPLASKPAAEVLNSDRKNYTDGSLRFALAQVEESNLELLRQRREELCSEMRKIIADDDLDFFGLLVTDAVRINSEFLVLGNKKIIRHLPFARLDDELFALPGVLSRKKQLLPQVLSVTGAFQKK